MNTARSGRTRWAYTGIVCLSLLASFAGCDGCCQPEGAFPVKETMNENNLRAKPGESESRIALPSHLDPQTAAEFWLKESSATVYVPLSASDSNTLRLLFVTAHTFTREAESEPHRQRLRQLAESIGFSIQIFTIDGITSTARYLALIDSTLQGRGLYLFRIVSSPAPTFKLLQAPHRMFDLGTGKLALLALFEGKKSPDAVFLNSAHRHLQPDGQRSKSGDQLADSARNLNHPLVTATLGLEEAASRIDVVQLHGFGKNGTERPQVIISSGRLRGSSTRASGLSDALSKQFEVARFPEDINELGGTQNAVKQALHPDSQFTHIELSPDARRELLESPAARGTFTRALF